MLFGRETSQISKASVIGKVGQKNDPAISLKNIAVSSLQAGLFAQVASFTESSRARSLTSDMMSFPLVSFPVTASLSQAWEVVHSTRYRHLPNLGVDDALVGILSDRDLQGTMKSVFSRTTPFIKETEGSVQNLVSHPVLVASPEAELCAIARVLLEERIGTLPIASEAGGLVGMITRSDILRVLVAHPDFHQWV